MNHDRVRQALVGVSGVHVTPYDDRGRVNDGLLERIVSGLADAGIDNIVTGGNTGEFYSLEIDEIEAVCRRAVVAAAGRSLVTAGVGRSLADAKRLAEFAAGAGADAIMIHQVPDPFASPRGVIAYTHAIANATPLPVVLYLRNDNFSSAEVTDLVGHPNIVGVKYAVPDPLRLSERIRLTAGRDVLWLCGLAELWAVPFAAVGARGFTSGLVNVLPRLSLAVRDALKSGDFAAARALVERIATFEAMRAREANGANVTVVKEAMRLMGIPVGRVRPPGTDALGPREVDELKGFLFKLNALDSATARAPA
jgi:4-hydroxy-tetrahydrodipicolinate synthase